MKTTFPRILAKRDGSGVQIFAAGFDSSRNIFLGERATKWEGSDHEVDGLTTNGILIMQPKGSFCSDEKGSMAKAGIWREISVRPELFHLQATRHSMSPD